jgi:hypothetical protein
VSADNWRLQGSFGRGDEEKTGAPAGSQPTILQPLTSDYKLIQGIKGVLLCVVTGNR